MARPLASLSRGLGRLTFVGTWLWTIGAAWFSEIEPAPLPRVLALAILIGFPLAWYRGNNRRLVAWTFVAFAVFAIAVWQFKRPSADRDWTPDMKRAATVARTGDLIAITDIRDCHYRTSKDFDVRHYTRTLDLNALRTVDFLVERFHAFKGLAHTLLSFGFEGGEQVCISVEVRREVGEGFGPVAGLFRQFELLYVVGSEQDLIGLRTNHRRSEVWLYPIKTTPERKRTLFVEMLDRATALQREPEFYNSLTSTCTTNIVDHVIDLVPGRIPFDWRVWLPGYSSDLAFELGLIDTSLSQQEAEAHFRIDAIAQQAPIDADFSRRIRSGR